MALRFCNCSEFKSTGRCKHLPILIPAEQQGEPKGQFKPLCNCSEYKQKGGSCKHIPPWLSTVAANEVQLYPPRKKIKFEDAAPSFPRTLQRDNFSSSVRLCNCSEFKEKGDCKHLPPPLLPDLNNEDDTVPFFQPFCNCDEWKNNGGNCKHIPTWLLDDQPADAAVQLYDPERRGQGFSSTVRGSQQAFQFCNCDAFKASGSCKHLHPQPPPANEDDTSPNFQPLCNCTEFKQNNGSCKHIPPWLVHQANEGVQLYDPLKKKRQYSNSSVPQPFDNSQLNFPGTSPVTAYLLARF